jgi:hypothetical protein
MDYAVFESRVMELLFKTGHKLTPQLVAFRVGCPVEVARKYLDHMASTDVVLMEVDANGGIQYDVHGRPPPSNEALSWTSGAGAANAAYGSAYPPAPVHQHGVAPVNIQIHNSAPPAVIVVGTPKSVGVAAFAGLFLGPLGMLYSTGIGALVMFLVSIILIPATAGLGFLVTAPVCAIWAASAASEHNRKLHQPMQAALAAHAVVHAPPQQYLPPPR